MFTRENFINHHKPRLKAYRWQAPIKGLCDQRYAGQNHHAHALYMENWVPDRAGLKLRSGYREIASLPNKEEIRKICPVHIGKKSYKLAMTNRGIYDVSNTGEGVALKEDCTSGKWSVVNFLNRLIMVNGRDVPLSYDGESLTPLELSMAGTHFSQINTYRNRIYLISENDTTLYYMDYKVFGGKVHELDLSTIMRKGGTLKALVTFAVDGGSGPHEILAVITTQGEVLLYRGDDPSVAEHFELIGTYNLPKLIHTDLICSFGDDVLLGSESGLIPLYGSLPLGMKTSADRSYTQAISKTLLDVIQEQKHYFGWQLLHLASKGWLMLHCPSGDQFIYHTAHHAWTKFTGFGASNWCDDEAGVYFSKGHNIYQLDDASDDDGMPIEAKLLTVFHDFGQSVRLKQTKQIRFNMAVGKQSYVSDQRLVNDQTAFGFKHLEWDKDPVRVMDRSAASAASALAEDFVEDDFAISDDQPALSKPNAIQNVALNQHAAVMGSQIALLLHVKSETADLILHDAVCTYILGGLS